jgi:hypothetical protein
MRTHPTKDKWNPKLVTTARNKSWDKYFVVGALTLMR